MAREVHRRSLLQALSLYLAVSWGVLEVVDVLAQNIGLPEWVFRLALTLLVIGLPITLVTALLQGFGRSSEESRQDGQRGHRRLRAPRYLFTWRNASLGGLAALILWTGVALGWVLFGRGPGAREAIDTVAGLDEVRQLIGDQRYSAAYTRARELEPSVVSDSLRGVLWSVASATGTLLSTPPGADVWMQPYDATEDEWEYLGQTPIQEARLTRGLSRVRLELEGYRTVLSAVRVRGGRGGSFVLDSNNSLPEGMTRVVGATFDVFLPGLEHLSMTLPDFFIDELEVTNADFKQFVDAGGYDRREFWHVPFIREGGEVAWEDAVADFSDRTGRPGPSGWEVGSYPDGMGDHPVGGVSWYEAAASARFRGKELPTLYHWYLAAAPGLGQFILPQSNFEQAGTAPVGSFAGLAPSGALDMAGNVREWVHNSSADDRFILGGAWNDPEYMFTDANAQSPFDRSEINGFRLIQPLDSLNLARAHEPIVRPHRDYFAEAPVSDEIFDVYRRLYTYDDTPLNAEVVRRDSAALWVRDEVTLDAAYGGERLTTYIYLPHDREPPLQAIVWFPGSGVIYRNQDPGPEGFLFDFIMKSGRALVYPIYKGTHSRGTDLSSDIQDETNSYREHVIQWSKDLGRSVDYVATRSDIDSDLLGYLGLSWGAAMSPVMTVIENRIKTSVLVSGGLVLQPTQPEVDPFNFLPRVDIPTLMINVPNDYFYPLNESQAPFYAFLGSPETVKHSILLEEGGHVPPINAVARAALAWYDRHLGPVR